jgi:phosphoribosylanthranilate isomerase
MTRVKVCGLTRYEDAALAAELGAFAIGVICWPGSRRAVTVAQAARVMAAVSPGVMRVGVFVNQGVDELRRWCDRVPLDAVQLHGDEADTFIVEAPRPVIRALSPERPGDEQVFERLPAGVVVLVDRYDPVTRGGTGQVTNWEVARRWAARRTVMLSGGLTADNVADAIRTVKPWAVDVASGVEASPGIKDAGRLRAFFQSVADV